MTVLKISDTSKEKSPSLIKSRSINHLMDPNFILQVNPQGVLGLKALEHMNAPKTTTMGGQIPYVLNQGLALSQTEDVKVTFRESSQDRVNIDLRVDHYNVAIASQKVISDFHGSFSEDKEPLDDGKYEVRRYPLTEKNTESIGFVPRSIQRLLRFSTPQKNQEIPHFRDKESVIDDKNAYYGHMKEWGRTVAKDALENAKIPGKVVLNYWDSYVAYTGMLEYWQENGLTQLPKTVIIPHSLGYRKLVSMLQDAVKKDLENLSKKGQVITEKDLKKSVTKNLESLMNNPRTCFPARILVEREMFSHKEFKGVLNSSLELKDQLLSGPYILDFQTLPKVEKSYSTVISPGIDTLRFGFEESDFMKKHEKHASEFLEERIQRDIPLSRRKLPIVLVVGRLSMDKNFHGVAKAFIADKELSSKANLVFVVNGNDKDLNVNYIKEMQKLLKGSPDAKPELLESFTGSARDTLSYLSTLLDKKELTGKYTAVSLPDGCDFAGLQRYLGKNKAAVSGLFSFKEPYGLSPLESMISGIPVVVSQFSGVADEILSAKGESFHPERDQEIADALKTTILDLSAKRQAQIEFAKTKTWDNPAFKLVRLMEQDGQSTYHDIRSTDAQKLDIDSPAFIAKGKQLIRQAISKDLQQNLESGKGPFSELIHQIQR